MRKFLTAVLLLLAVSADARPLAPPANDPWAGQINDTVYGPVQISSCGTSRDQTVNPAQKKLVLIVAGQSNWENITPTLYTPANASAVSTFNVYDGGSYSIGGPLCGTQTGTGAGQGPGHIAVRVADTFVTNGIFNTALVVPVAINGTSMANWATATLYNRVCQAISRLASRGMTPSTTGVTFAFLWGQGESDQVLGTSQASYTASFNSMFSSLQACGLTGFRSFILKETWVSGSVSAAVQAAQAAVLDGSTKFAGGDADSLNAANRIADNIHFNDAGAAALATLVYNAMHATGSPF